MKFTLGFSPCPNDTFIFDALVNQKIDTEGFSFEPVLEDVETLNRWTLEGKLDITKLSFPAFFRALDTYVMLHAGSALGKGVGPLLVKKAGVQMGSVADQKIALPGINTTANLLFSFAYPDATNKEFILFSEIEERVAEEEAGLGVIIHENRFTYAQKGLEKVRDLGEYWEDKMKVPIPLGGIVIKRSIDSSVARKINRLIHQSLQLALDHYPLITDYVKMHSQAMQEEVMRKHIDLYVNNYSLDLGPDGQTAIETLHQVFLDANHLIDTRKASLFL